MTIGSIEDIFGVLLVDTVSTLCGAAHFYFKINQ
jgi:hypothetical protein